MTETQMIFWLVAMMQPWVMVGVYFLGIIYMTPS